MTWKSRFLSYRTASVVLFAVLLGVVLATFRSYGIAWDEPLRLAYGRYLIGQYTGSPIDQEDVKAVETTNLYLYGGAFDILATSLSSLLAKLTVLDEVARWHLINGLVGLLGVLGCWLAARCLAGESAAFWAALLLAATPGYSGQMFINPKDIPLAVGYIWALAFLLVLIRGFPRLRPAALVGFTISSGLAMGVRAGGIFLLAYLLLALLLNFSLSAPSPSAKPGDTRRRISVRGLFYRVILPFGLTALAALGIMWAFWPWAAADPARRTLQALAAQGKFDWANTTLFRGRFISPEHLPWSYTFEYLLITLPELVLVVLAVGAVLGLGAVKRQRFSELVRSPGSQSFAFVGLAFLTPILAVLFGGAVLYDGIRHLTFILPPLACLAGAALAALLNRLQRWSPMVYAAALILIGGYLVYHVSLLVRLHPYEYVYYNRLVGGVQGAAGRYETEYWGTAFSESSRWLVDQLQASGSLGGDRYRVFQACGNDFSANYYFPKGVKITHDPAAADFLLGGIRWFCQDNLTGKILYTVSRMGVTLAVVKEP